MNSSGQRSAAVTASGVIAILGSLVTAIGILIGIMGMLLASRFPNPEMETMPGIRAMIVAVMAIFFGITVWGAFSGVGLIRFRNWARISVLVWAGLMAPFCILVIAFIAFMPMPPSPNPMLTGSILHLVTIIFYGVPMAIAVWWLILFTRPHIVAQFKLAAAAGTGDPFGAIPVTAMAVGSVAPVAYAVPMPLPAPSVPIPIIVLSCFFLLSSLSVFFIFFTHLPAMVFGHAFTGLTGSVIYASWCLLYVIAGVGMLKRFSWAYSVAIGLQIVHIVSGIMTVLSPNFDDAMRRAMAAMKAAPPEMYQVPSMTHLRGYSVLGLLFPLAILGLLAYYRPRFLEACAAKGGNSPAQSSTPGDSTTPGSSAPQAPSQSIEPVA
jgi:hypothetical protein